MYTKSGLWIHGIAEDNLEIQNPTSLEKLHLLASQINLSPGQRVLDAGAGRGGPALIFAEMGCHVTALEWFPGFIAGGKERAEVAGVAHLIDWIEGDAEEFAIEPNSCEAAICLGATFIWDGLETALDALTKGVKPGGHVVVGELHQEHGEPAVSGALSFEALLETFEERGLWVSTVIRAERTDWDRYISGRLKGILDWLDANLGHPDYDEVKEQRRNEYVELFRPSDSRGWAIVAARRPNGRVE